MSTCSNSDSDNEKTNSSYSIELFLLNSTNETEKQIEQNELSRFICSICSDIPHAPITTNAKNCSHIFCSTCLQLHIEAQKHLHAHPIPNEQIEGILQSDDVNVGNDEDEHKKMNKFNSIVQIVELYSMNQHQQLLIQSKHRYKI
jgi:hypothetical protein